MRQKQSIISLFLLSPSSRRAWIEMLMAARILSTPLVALLAEGVDRNVAEAQSISGLSVALLAEGVDRNFVSRWRSVPAGESPSSRRAWIEI